ncbi:MAG: ribosome assembly factor SBDS [Candidatus Woesearchaeota archaeon]
MSQGHITYDKERVSFNLARLKAHGMVFEVVVDPDLAIDYKEKIMRAKDASSVDPSITEVLKSEHVFADASKGVLAPEYEFENVFGSTDVLEIAKRIIKEGEIQITAEHRSKLREKKKNRILDIIHRNAIDPKSGLPHPVARIDSALEEAKVKVDEFKKAEDQIDSIVKKINVILPLKFDKKKISVTVFSEHAAKLYGFFKKWNIIDESWNSDGSLTVLVEVPAGLQEEFFDELNDLTQGGNETKIIE